MSAGAWYALMYFGTVVLVALFPLAYMKWREWRNDCAAWDRAQGVRQRIREESRRRLVKAVNAGVMGRPATWSHECSRDNRAKVELPLNESCPKCRAGVYGTVGVAEVPRG